MAEEYIRPEEMVAGKYYIFYTRNYTLTPVKMLGLFIGPTRFPGLYQFSNVIVNENPEFDNIHRSKNYSVRNVILQGDEMNKIENVSPGSIKLIYSLLQVAPGLSNDTETIDMLTNMLNEELYSLDPVPQQVNMKAPTNVKSHFFGGKKSRKSRKLRKSRKQRRR